MYASVGVHVCVQVKVSGLFAWNSICTSKYVKFRVLSVIKDFSYLLLFKNYPIIFITWEIIVLIIKYF